MADQTAIEWCDSTFNPWIGCTRVSPACDHCYAAVSAPARVHGITWGAGQPRQRTSPGNWKLPLRWNAEPFYQCVCGHRGTAAELMKLPNHNGCVGERVRRRVFCASLADVFDNEVDPQWRADLFDLIAATPNLDWLLLTKRIGNVASMVPGTWRPVYPRNVWLGATICNQPELTRDIWKLFALPARIRFLSIEPLLGRVDLCETLGMWWNQTMGCFESCSDRWNPHGLDWVIVGGESGPGARPMHPEWVRAIRRQCAAAGVPFLFKQWGEWVDADNGPDDDAAYDGKPECWVDPSGRAHDGELGVDFFHGTYAMYRTGKKAAGRTLDGATHTAFPEPR